MEICEHVEGHGNDSATILDLALTSLRFDAGLLRNISTELYHVLIMLTKRTSTAVGAQGGRAGGAGSLSPSPSTILTSFNSRDRVEMCGFAGNHVQW